MSSIVRGVVSSWVSGYNSNSDSEDGSNYSTPLQTRPQTPFETPLQSPLQTPRDRSSDLTNRNTKNSQIVKPEPIIKMVCDALFQEINNCPRPLQNFKPTESHPIPRPLSVGHSSLRWKVAEKVYLWPPQQTFFAWSDCTRDELKPRLQKETLILSGKVNEGPCIPLGSQREELMSVVLKIFNHPHIKKMKSLNYLSRNRDLGTDFKAALTTYKKVDLQFTNFQNNCPFPSGLARGTKCAFARLGNCEDMSLAFICMLKEEIPDLKVQLVGIKNGDHSFVVINPKTAKGDVFTSEEEGENAIVVDAWSRSALPPEADPFDLPWNYFGSVIYRSQSLSDGKDAKILAVPMIGPLSSKQKYKIRQIF